MIAERHGYSAAYPPRIAKLDRVRVGGRSLEPSDGTRVADNLSCPISGLGRNKNGSVLDQLRDLGRDRRVIR